MNPQNHHDKWVYTPNPILFLNFFRTFILLRIGASRSSTHWQRPPTGPAAPNTPIKSPKPKSQNCPSQWCITYRYPQLVRHLTILKSWWKTTSTRN